MALSSPGRLPDPLVPHRSFLSCTAHARHSLACSLCWRVSPQPHRLTWSLVQKRDPVTAKLMTGERPPTDWEATRGVGGEFPVSHGAYTKVGEPGPSSDPPWADGRWEGGWLQYAASGDPAHPGILMLRGAFLTGGVEAPEAGRSDSCFREEGTPPLLLVTAAGLGSRVGQIQNL